MLELNNFFAQVAFALHAQPTSLFIEEFAVEMPREAASRGEHFVEGTESTSTVWQGEKKTDAWIVTGPEFSQVEGTWFYETCNTESYRAVIAGSGAVKYAVLSMAKTGFPEGQDQLVAGESIFVPGHQANSHNTLGGSACF